MDDKKTEQSTLRKEIIDLHNRLFESFDPDSIRWCQYYIKKMEDFINDLEPKPKRSVKKMKCTRCEGESAFKVVISFRVYAKLESDPKFDVEGFITEVIEKSTEESLRNVQCINGCGQMLLYDGEWRDQEGLSYTNEELEEALELLRRPGGLESLEEQQEEEDDVQT